MIILYNFCFSKKKLIKLNNTYNYYLFEQNYYFNVYYKLKDKLYVNISLLNEEKKFINNLLSDNKTINSIKEIFFSSDAHFGNLLSTMNKLIFYCEIIGCRKIILDKKKFWFINNKINITELNITIEVKDKKFKKKDSLYYNSSLIFYTFYRIRPEIRINFIRNEIIKNLPKVKTCKEYLYIHIRSGDIFNKKPCQYYAQPPLCFYKIILNNYKFERIYLLTEKRNNPVINKLSNIYPNIIFTNNSTNSLIYNPYNNHIIKGLNVIFLI